MEVLLNSGHLRALLLMLSEGGVVHNCLLDAVILASAAIFQSIIDVTSQWVCLLDAIILASAAIFQSIIDVTSQ